MDVSRPLMILGLVMAEVGLWQWRMIIAARGRRALAMLLGAVGATLQITAISQVVTNLDDPLSVTAYAAGVGVGVVAGLVVGDLVTPGTIGVTVITSSPGLAQGLWELGWPATIQAGRRHDGPVDIVFVAINRRQEPALHKDVGLLAPDAHWSAGERTSVRAARLVAVS
jgi:uncharacterized protein YebE (UPF0316 family)